MSSHHKTAETRKYLPHNCAKILIQLQNAGFLITLEETKMPDIKVNKCVLCKEEFYGFGHNPQPLGEGRCCSACNDNLVIPVRIERAFGISSSVTIKRKKDGK